MTLDTPGAPCLVEIFRCFLNIYIYILNYFLVLRRTFIVFIVQYLGVTAGIDFLNINVGNCIAVPRAQEYYY